ncbi:uncharacterized protein LOC113846452 isoform X2 [Abrus precatorius]|uniref:Uncharacterized protein LOC113846452 isoform X2 n=1 Tax=Abrus precatorius TaxID=3816 RepID=A0A8B8JGG9_ABRPR|nr:uncharacterized protein LOC113846452 isoform X2 [Abrus precatorius]
MDMATSSFVLGSDFKYILSLKNTKTLSGFGALRHTHPNGLFSKSFHFHALSARMVKGTTKMVSDVYVGGDTSIRVNSKMYTKLDSCLVFPPTPNRAKPRAIIKFIGGAFIGAIPEVTYGYLIEFLAKEGFVVVVVPYNVTFDHAQAAKQVYERFHTCLDTILISGLPPANLSPAQLEGLPLFSVGHSNGALLQLLTGSLFSEKIPKANAIISYNNRPATEAVPYFEQLGPAVNQMMAVMEATPFYSIARNASGDAWKMMLDTVGSILQESEQEILNSLTKFVDQLPSVMNEVKFNFDPIDETDILEETIKTRVESLGGKLEKVQLSGNHITPCIQEPRWQVGNLYTPADAVAQGLKSLSLNETRILARTISEWFRGFED